MPRNISFFLTTPQFIDGSKDVTRRMGWAFAEAGMELMGVEKGQGLGKGGKVRQLGLILLADVRREVLRRMIDEPEYGAAEVIREGFPGKTPRWFVDMFCASHKGCAPESVITRLEFAKVARDGER
jgi:hypothetical protein